MSTTTSYSPLGYSLLLLLLYYSSSLWAISGAELAYECLGPNEYRIVLNVYRECTEATLPNNQNVSIYSPSASCNSPFVPNLPLEQSYEVSGLHPSIMGNSTCNGGTFKGFEVYVYADTVHFPLTCANWIVSWTGCCRNPAFTNLASSNTPIYIEARINSHLQHSSPQFEHSQLTYHCANSLSPSFLDGPTGYPSGIDSFVTVLTCPRQSNSTCVAFSAGYSASQPILVAPGSSMLVDNIRRKIFFEPRDYVTQLPVVTRTIYSLRNGDTVGYVQSELPVLIHNYNPLSCNSGVQILYNPVYTSGGHISDYDDYHPAFCDPNALVFSFIAYDPDGDTININPITTNLDQQLGVNSYSIFMNTSPPYRLDSVQIFVQIQPPSTTANTTPSNGSFLRHIRMGLTDNSLPFPSHTYLDMSLRGVQLQFTPTPDICPYDTSFVALQAVLEHFMGSQPFSISWRQVSGPFVIFSDPNIPNPFVTLYPANQGDSVVLEATASTPVDPITGAFCTFTSNLVLHYNANGSCASTFPNAVVGAIRRDDNQDCLVDSTDSRWTFGSILLFENGVDSFYYSASGNQDYEAYLDTGTYQVSIVPSSLEPFWQTCSPSQSITIDTNINPQVLDWVIEPVAICPKLEVNLSASPMRPCVSRPLTIQYRNRGTATAYNGAVELTLDSFMTITYSNRPITSQVGHVYRFEFDSLPVGGVDYIVLYLTSPTCTLPFNTPYTINAHVYPDSLCFNSIPNLVIQDSCDLDSAYFKVINYAAAHTTPQPYWIIENQTVVDTGSVQLGQGQSLTISYPMSASKVYQLVINPQSNAYAASLVVDCKGNTTFTPPLFQPNHQLDYVSTVYRGTVGSYDPNIKVAEPAGWGVHHYLQPNTPIDYTIHFQNTGNDTAYQVVILDTLSAHLNVGSIQPLGSSHPYTWRFMPYDSGHVRVVEFRFDNILLVDSVTNEPASHGYVHYSIQQQPNLADFTRLENSAAIYFDYNPPIITNTAFHTICANCHLTNITNGSIIVANPVLEQPAWDVKIYPNPLVGNQLTLQQSSPTPCRVELFDLNGVLLQSQSTQQTISTLELPELPAGAYFLRITRNDASQVLKLIKQ